jgi:peptide/nickel transport system permease protein
MVPGDPVLYMLRENADTEAIERLRMQLGLDLPLHLQYFNYLERILRGDLGRSMVSNVPVLELILSRAPLTLELAVAAVVIGVSLGIPAGVIAAVHQYSKWDYILMAGAILGISMPEFWVGLMLILVFSLGLGWLPSSGYGGVDHMLMPAFTLALSAIGVIARLTRSEMLGTIRQDYIRTARAKGLTERAVIYVHALRNALIPVVTWVGLRFGWILCGAVVVETIFAWPGVGSLAILAINSRDYIMLQGIVLFMAVVFTTINLVVDLTYAYLDPRIGKTLK